MPLKIFLTADVHIGLKFSNYPKIQQKLIDARFLALETCISRANEAHCDLFAVAGDLFDHARVADKDILRCTKILDGFEGKAVVVLPGNHDFCEGPESKLWHKFRQHSGDRTLLLSDAAVYALTAYDLDAHLYACPCHAKHSGTNATGWINGVKKAKEVAFHVGIAHGSLQGVSPDAAAQYYPMTTDELLGYNLDCWLMGHTDRLQHPTPGEFERIFYPGTPEPNSFNCERDGKAWILTIDDQKRVSAESIAIGTYSFRHKECTVSSPDDLDALVRSNNTELADRLLLKLTISGSLPRNEHYRIAEAIARLRDQLFYLEEDCSSVRPNITADDIDKEYPEGSFPHRLLSELAKEDETGLALQTAYELLAEVKQ